MLIPVNQHAFVLQDIDFSSIKDAKPTHLSFLLVKANWCPHCVDYMRPYEQYSVKYPNINFLVLESTENQELLEQWSKLISPAFKCEGFPTVVLYTNGTPSKVVENRFELDRVIREHN